MSILVNSANIPSAPASVKDSDDESELRSRFRRMDSSDTEIADSSSLVEEKFRSGKKINRLRHWMRRTNILNYIFGQHIHLEILQRSTDIIMFLIKFSSFGINDFKILWASITVTDFPLMISYLIFEGKSTFIGHSCSIWDYWTNRWLL
jgi:hypothetical protein